MAKGQITDAATGEAIIGAMISFVPNNERMFVKLSANGAGFGVKNREETVYSVTISKMVCTTQTILLAVDETKPSVIKVAPAKGLEL